ncbi:MAG: flagellar motor switch protein FliG [Spirochaetales bacterium]|jgi:flagellar motor switch protein FliG|nr:flagellar motor switch protein FliG [Spirochaetales bacterium]
MDRRKEISELYKKTMKAGSGSPPAADTPEADEAPPSRGKARGFLRLTGKGRETSVRKAAKFLMLIGKDEAAKVMQHLAPEEVEAIAREIAGIRRIENAEAEKILTEFGLLRESLSAPSGGVDAARRILVNAFGEEKGRELLSRSLPPEEEKFFSFLEDLEPQQIHLLTKNETPAVLAVIIPCLRAETASKVFPLFEPAFRGEMIRRMAKKEKIARDVLLRMEEALREKARKLSAPAAAQDMDGKGILAEILKYVDVSEEEKILKNIEDENPVIAEEIKERLFTIDVLDSMDDGDLQKILRDMQDREIALLLKGKADGIRAKILTNVSERRRAFVTDEYRILGPVPKKDADIATKDFLNVLRRLETAGEITFRRENDTWV